MSNVTLVCTYGLMVLFDLSVLGGTAFLVSYKNWSVWWMLLAIFMCMGSNPKTIITEWKKNNEQQNCQGTTR